MIHIHESFSRDGYQCLKFPARADFTALAKEEHRELLSVFSSFSLYFPDQIPAETKARALVKSLSGNWQLVFNHDT